MNISLYRVRVANELGAGNANGAKFATIVSMIYSLLIGLLYWSIIIAIPEKLAMIFTSSAAVITMIKELAVLLAFTILLNCIQPVLSGYLGRNDQWNDGSNIDTIYHHHKMQMRKKRHRRLRFILNDAAQN
ncbi:hypothetical protein Dsin_002864 [Dipteronia sinensis]|uniref:Uncharacterized protein n=1 Tax=Dipteronia sinensis TaxID=43782 RepID=A0AAE0B6M6_9ROSI|nr:hypothetical protein Dsin_002864 [Dipteronia sinensis]